MEKEIQLKPCTPQDVEQAVPLIYASGPDAFEYVFKNNKISALDFLRFTFVKENGEFSYKNHYALYKENKIVGIVATFNAETAKKFTLADAKNILAFYKLKAFGVMLKGLRVEQIIKIPVGNEIVIGHLGIDAEKRGQGLGTICLQEIQKTINKTKEQKIVLDVSEENPRAKKLYERLGFKVVKHNLSKLRNKYSYVPNHFRMKYK